MNSRLKPNYIIAVLAWICLAFTMDARAASDNTLFDFSAAS
jgi:hypothetical protein